MEWSGEEWSVEWVEWSKPLSANTNKTNKDTLTWQHKSRYLLTPEESAVRACSFFCLRCEKNNSKQRNEDTSQRRRNNQTPKPIEATTRPESKQTNRIKPISTATANRKQQSNSKIKANKKQSKQKNKVHNK